MGEQTWTAKKWFQLDQLPKMLRSKLSIISHFNFCEYLFKNFQLHVPSFSEKDRIYDNWNLCCFGKMEIDKATSTAIIKPDMELTNYDATQICKAGK